MFISMYSILNSYITSNKVGGDMSVASVVKLFGDRNVFIIISRTFEWSIRYETCPNSLTCVVSLILMGTFTNIVLITIFSVTFVAGIAFAIPTVISKVGLW